MSRWWWWCGGDGGAVVGPRHLSRPLWVACHAFFGARGLSHTAPSLMTRNKRTPHELIHLSSGER